MAWGACHAGRPLPGLAVFALVPLFLLLGSRRPAWWGWLHGVSTWCVAVWWIVPTITTYGRLDGWIGGLALLLLASILALYDAAFAGLGARLWRNGSPLALAALPALWIALEWGRGRILSGFPWNLAAHAWIELPGALPLASWIGAFGVSGLVLLPSLGLARAWVARRWEPAAIALLIPLFALPLAARHALPPDAETAPVSIAIVQPDTPNRPLFDPRANLEDYRRLLALSEPVCRPGRLLVWPESATWPRDWQDDPGLRSDVSALAAKGCSVLLNSPFEVGEDVFNSVLLVGGRDTPVPLQRADKRHLVPFGEYVPFRRALPFLGKIARTVGDFRAAEEIRLLEWRDERLGVAVCYEVVFPGEVAALVRAGATLLVTVTNDAWYGDTAAPRQHLRAARFRAAENRRWLLRAAVTGISAVVRPDGSVAARLGVGERGSMPVPVFGRDDRSPYSRAPWLVPLLALLGATAACVGFRSRRRSGAGQ